MADKQAVSELLGKMGWLYDTGDMDGVVNSFTEDAVFDLAIEGAGKVGSFEGREVIRGLYEGAHADQTDQRRHAVTNIWFGEETDTTIKATSYLVLISIENGALTVLSTGVYNDEVVLVDGEWKIKHRDLYLDLPY